MATKAQAAHALNSYFSKVYKRSLGFEYHGNVFRDKWGFQNMIEDLGEERAKKVIDWYFKTSREQFSPADLHKNYDRLSFAMDEHEQEQERAREALKRTQEAVERFKNRRESGLD